MEFAKHGTPAELAARFNVSQASISNWRGGQRTPIEAKQIEIEEALGIPREWWREPPPAPPPGEPFAPVVVGSLAVAREETLKLAGELLNAARQLAGKANDPALDVREQAGVLRALTPTIQALSKLSGSMLELSEAQVVKSPAFASVLERMVAALEPYPEAMRTLIDALESVSS